MPNVKRISARDSTRTTTTEKKPASALLRPPVQSQSWPYLPAVS